MSQSPALVAPAVAASGRAARLRDPLATLAVAVAGTTYVGLVDPNEAGHYPSCPFLSLTGLYCPGCGSLRAVHALAQGDVLTALDRNVLTVAGAVLLAAIWVGRLTRAWRGVPRARAAAPWMIWTLLALVLAFTVARNLPAGALLAP